MKRVVTAMVNRHDIVAEIQRCREQKATRPAFGADADGAPFDLAEAYRIQQYIAQQKEQAGDPIVGYKLGLISPAKQQQMNVDEPIVGHLHRSMLHDPGESIVVSRFIQPRVEPEIALVFGADVTDPDQWEGAAAYALLTVDILDSIYGGYRFQAADVVADNASGGAVIIGSQPLPPDMLWRQEGTLRLSLDGGPWVEGALADLGDPRALLAWAVQRIHSFGRGLRKGDVLLLGAPCAAVPIGEAAMLTVEGPRGTSLIARFER